MRWVAALVWLAGPAAAQVWPVALPGEAVWSDATTPGRHALATGPWDGASVPLVTLDGAVAREVRETDAADPLALLAPLREALEAQGWTVALDCLAAACGGFDFRAAIEVVPPPVMFVDLGDYGYLSARKGEAGISLLASRSEANGFLQAIAVTPSEAAPVAEPGTAEGGVTLAPGLRDAFARLDPAGIPTALDTEGRAVLSGLTFAAGSAELTEAGGDLEQVAAWMEAHPDARIALVGHTDADGGLAGNLALSERRARAAAERLRALGVEGARIETGGAGWLAPLAPHGTPGAAAANRRVEAVVLPPA